MHTSSFARSAAELLQRIFAPVERPNGPDGFQWDYSCSDDVLSAWIGEPQPSDKVVVDKHIVVRISRQTHQVIGIDVLAASQRSRKWTGALDGAMARALLQQHGPAALAIWRTRAR
jgi:hypothetical protein